jgi:hypothetical protein
MPEMSRVCGDCKHWGVQGRQPKRFEVCTAIGGKESEPSVGAQAYLSNPDAWFLTAANFGCALFEKKSGVHPRGLVVEERHGFHGISGAQLTADEPRL